MRASQDLLNRPVGQTAADLLAPLLGLLPLLWIVGFGGLWMGATWDTGSETRSGPGLVQLRPRAFAALLGALFVEAVVSLIVAHVTKTEHAPVRPLSFPLPFAWAVAAGKLTLAWPLVPLTAWQQEVLLLGYLAGAVAYLAIFLAFIVNEFTSALQIQCFSIKTKKLA